MATKVAQLDILFSVDSNVAGSELLDSWFIVQSAFCPRTIDNGNEEPREISLGSSLILRKEAKRTDCDIIPPGVFWRII